MDDPGKLVVGGVYFTIDFVDEALRFPCLQSYVYLGSGLFPEGGADEHLFQTVESYSSQGSWSELSADARRTFDSNTLIICGSKDLGLMSNADELVDELQAYSDRLSR